MVLKFRDHDLTLTWDYFLRLTKKFIRIKSWWMLFVSLQVEENGRYLLPYIGFVDANP
jgi:hypothetical protein